MSIENPQAREHLVQMKAQLIELERHCEALGAEAEEFRAYAAQAEAKGETALLADIQARITGLEEELVQQQQLLAQQKADILATTSKLRDEEREAPLRAVEQQAVQAQNEDQMISDKLETLDAAQPAFTGSKAESVLARIKAKRAAENPPTPDKNNEDSSNDG